MSRHGEKWATRHRAGLRELGVSDEEIQTDQISIHPIHDHRRELDLYEARNTFVVKLTAPDRVDELVTTALQSGVNYIHGIEFQTTEFKKHRPTSA